MYVQLGDTVLNHGDTTSSVRYLDGDRLLVPQQQLTSLLYDSSNKLYLLLGAAVLCSRMEQEGSVGANLIVDKETDRHIDIYKTKQPCLFVQQSLHCLEPFQWQAICFARTILF
jgi:hypothetical protein